MDSVVTSTGANNHVGVGGRVTLQAAQAIICGKRDLRVKGSFYTSSHRSFVTATAKNLAGLKVVSKEWIALTTFGEIERKWELREMTEVNVVPEISQVQNEHIEVVKQDYSKNPRIRTYNFPL